MILLPIWKREKITKICMDNLQQLQKDFNIEVMCVVSEKWAKIEAIKRGFKQVFASNEDLGEKHNVGVKEALCYKWDYLMNLGSDDIITKKLFKLYEPYFEKNLAMFGSTKVTFIDSRSKEVKGKDYGLLIGAGRCIRRDLIEEVPAMYDSNLKCGLDLNSMGKFHKYSHTEIDNGFDTIFDIKSETNIWKYEMLKGKSLNFDSLELETETLDKILDL